MREMGKLDLEGRIKRLGRWAASYLMQLARHATMATVAAPATETPSPTP